MNTSKILNFILAFALVIVSIVAIRAVGNNETDAETVSETEGPKEFKEIDIRDLNENAYKLFHEDWFVLTAGKEGRFNPMTISWGNIGILWQTPTVTVYVRPDRYTYEFMEKSRYFTISSFPEAYRDQVLYLGQASGRDGDKVAATGFTPAYTENGSMYYLEADLVIECEIIYADDLKREKITYDNADYHYDVAQKGAPAHKMYIGKITKILRKEATK